MSNTTFAPSELVLLLGDRFAGPGSFTQGKEELLAGSGTVAQNELAQNVLVVALLAMEQAGEIRIAQEKKKALLGLMTRQTVVAEATGSRAAWPAGSLEGELRETINGSRPEVWDVVARWLGNDMRSPEGYVLDRVKRGLVGRGLVQREEKRTMKIFTSHSDSLPDATRTLLAGQSPDALLRLLKDGARGETVDLLRKQVAKALNLRTESSND
ncbi:MAG TPA: hypothetical protein VF613_05490 [Longimicrobium sp.]|jgi:hypothetical protein